MNPTEQFFEITPQDQKISFDIIKTDYKNERQKIEIEVIKSDKDSAEKLKGAVYGLYAAEDIFSNIEFCDEKQKWMIREVPELVVEKDTLIEKRMTDENGNKVEIDTSRLSSAYILLLLAYIRVNLNRSLDKPRCCFRLYKGSNTSYCNTAGTNENNSLRPVKYIGCNAVYI